MWALFSTKRLKIAVAFWPAYCQFWSWPWTPLIRPHWDPNVTRCKTVLFLLCPRTPLSQGFSPLTLTAPRPGPWGGARGWQPAFTEEHGHPKSSPGSRSRSSFLSRLLEDVPCYYPSLRMRKLSPETLCNLPEDGATQLSLRSEAALLNCSGIKCKLKMFVSAVETLFSDTCSKGGLL